MFYLSSLSYKGANLSQPSKKQWLWASFIYLNKGYIALSNKGQINNFSNEGFFSFDYNKLTVKNGEGTYWTNLSFLKPISHNHLKLSCNGCNEFIAFISK